jgi:trehalose/maltose hydrolase-like predicted phosphorylase
MTSSRGRESQAPSPSASPWSLGLILGLSLLPQLSAAAATSDFELTATQQDFNLYFPTYLANGFFSAQSSLRGTDATLAHMAGLMDYTRDDVSRPAAIPSWTEIDYFNGKSWLNNSPLTLSAFLQYRQTLNMYDGTLTTRYVWADGGNSTQVAISTFVSEDAAHLGVTSLSLTPDFDGPIRLRFTLRPWPSFPHRLALGKLTLSQAKQAIATTYKIPRPPETALLSQVLKPASPTAANRAAIWYPGEVDVQSSGGSDSERVLWIHGHAVNGAGTSEAAAIALPEGLRNLRVTVESSSQIVALNVEGSVEKGKSYEFTKFVAVSHDKWGGPVEEDVRAAKAARTAGFSALLDKHQAAWHVLWKSDILVSGDSDLQRAIHSDLFYVLENSSIDTALPMTACGFSAHYLHHVFWDNDSWDVPVLLLLHPQRAKSQLMFRYRTLRAAEENAGAHGYKGAMFPWESDPLTGTEQTPYFAHENAQREIHINGDVAIAQWQYYLATGDLDWLRTYGYPVIRATADFWTSRVVYQMAVGRYEILHVTSPDEAYTDVNNDSFTNAIAQRNLVIATAAAKALGETPKPEWSEIAQKLYIPFSDAEQRHLDFDPSVAHDKQTWMGSSISFLAYPPLDLSMSPQVRRNDFDFALRSIKELTPDANAMLLAMISVEAAELSDAGAADTWLRRQQSGFLKPPFNVRSETALNNTTYILATSAGFLQNFLYGFSGLRITEEGLVSRYPAVMPAAWKTLTLKNIEYRGQHFDYVLSRDRTGKVQATRRTPTAAAPGTARQKRLARFDGGEKRRRLGKMPLESRRTPRTCCGTRLSC